MKIKYCLVCDEAIDDAQSYCSEECELWHEIYGWAIPPFVIGQRVWCLCEEDAGSGDWFPLQVKLLIIPMGKERLNTFWLEEDCQKRCDELHKEHDQDADPCNGGHIGYV